MFTPSARAVVTAGAAHGRVEFTAVGASTWVVPAGVFLLTDVLIVAGGANGGSNGSYPTSYPGGGGAGGGVRHLVNYPVTPGSPIDLAVGDVWQDSSFDGVVSNRGGLGGSATSINGKDGGSGGGGGAPYGVGGDQLPPYEQGNTGGTAGSSVGGTGGGRNYLFEGKRYGSGGGGGGSSTSLRDGQSEWAGKGGSTTQDATDAAPNSGGGGGGAGKATSTFDGAAGKGASGTIIIKW